MSDVYVYKVLSNLLLVTRIPIHNTFICPLPVQHLCLYLEL